MLNVFVNNAMIFGLLQANRPSNLYDTGDSLFDDYNGVRLRSSDR